MFDLRAEQANRFKHKEQNRRHGQDQAFIPYALFPPLQSRPMGCWGPSTRTHEQINRGPTRATLRKLATSAYERGLNKLLTELGERFTLWQSGDITTADLNECIHEYHDATARDLWKRYHQLKPSIAVALAIANGTLRPEDLPDLMRKSLLELAETLGEDSNDLTEDDEP